MTRAERLSVSFDRVPFTQRALHDALRAMCPQALLSRTGQRLARGINHGHLATMHTQWSPTNPTRHCCYFVTEMVFWYCAPTGSLPMGVRVEGDVALHRFVRWPDGVSVDVTRDQYGDDVIVAYDRAKGLWFLPAHTRTPGGGYQRGVSGPSRRARTLAAHLGLTTLIPKSVSHQAVLPDFR